MRGDQAQALVAALAAAFPDAVVGPETLQLYGRFLSDVDEDIGAAAVTTWIARERRFPFIADVRALVDDLSGTAPPDADRAWAEVLSAVKRARIPLRWSHDAVRLAVEAVGVNEIGQSTQLGVERAHFIKAYEAAKRRTSDERSRTLVQSIVPEMRQLMEYPALGKTAQQLPGGKKR